MRLTSEIFVSAILRRVFSGGGYAAVLHKGAREAGAVFVRQRSRLGTETLYAPAPQSFFEAEVPAGRLFEIRLRDVEGTEVDAAIDRELRFDRDCWVVEIEGDLPADLIDIVGDTG